MIIESVIYTTDNGQSYQIEFDRTKDHISFEHYKTVKYLTLNDLLKLRDNIDKIIIKFTNDNPNSHNCT